MQEPIDISLMQVNDDGSRELVDGEYKFMLMTNGTKFWFKNRSLHRDGDLPAIEYADSRKE